MAQPVSSAPYRDRSGLLIFFGIVELLLAVVCLLLGTLCLAFVAGALPGAAAAPQTQTMAMWMNVLVYFAAGAFLVTMGIGTIRAKRWARALMLLTSWPVFATFLLGGIALALVTPKIIAALPKEPGKPDVGPVVWVFLTVLYLVLTAIPLSFILFYSGRNVRATFAARDPGRSWVDGRPLPIVGFAGALALYGQFSLLGLARQSFGVFGVLLKGGPAVVAMVLNGLLCLWLAWQIFRMTRNGWWANLAYAILLHLSGWVTFRVVGMERMVEAAGVQAAEAQKAGVLEFAGQFATWIMPASLILWVLTLLWLRRFYPPGTFTPPRTTDSPGIERATTT